MPITVAELIEQLQEYDQYTKAWIKIDGQYKQATGIDEKELRVDGDIVIS